MNDRPECDHLVGRLKQICRGEAGLTRDQVNKYRRLWQIAPLPLSAEVIVLDSPQTRAQAAKKQISSPSPRLPPLAVRVVNFAKAFGKHAQNGFQRRTRAEVRALVAICEQCPFFDKKHCLKCGCDCSGKNVFLNKLAWRSEKCPEGRW